MADEQTTPPGEGRAVSRRTIAIVFGVLCAGLVAGYALFLRTDYAVVYSGLKPADAAAIVAQLDAKSVPHRLRDDGGTILVPADQADSVRLAVAGSDVPLKGAVGFELFNKSDMGLTDFAQKINYQRALQGELTRSITLMEGVETARVHLALPERSLFRTERGVPKAAVEVVTKLGSTLGADRVRGIQQLVASAVTDLDPGAVTVLDGDGRVVSDGVSARDAASTELSEQAAAQAYYAARIRVALTSSFPGFRFGIHVLVDPGQVAAVPAAADENAKEDTARTFPLRITIVSETALNAEDQGIARQAVETAVALREQIGDTLAFQVGPTNPAPAPQLPSPADTMSAPAPSPTWTGDTRPEAPFSWWWIGLGAGALALGIAFATTRGRGLTTSEREAFVSRVRTELGTRDVDVRA